MRGVCVGDLGIRGSTTWEKTADGGEDALGRGSQQEGIGRLGLDEERSGGRPQERDLVGDDRGQPWRLAASASRRR